MYLKSIEIRGFKSFADRTHLDFREGITAVVGPNGSGKSNISDAVRWVLGEQSVKSLRGGKMEDVIFSGTEYRKPLGFAEVTLVLDNSSKSLPVAFTEVSVTRKLYRSGDSEYLINNNQCRLRDIHEMFMDTGIGKEGYSLIGQGKIEAILSGKMEDRRALLEEAAGIVKYKSRKEEAEKKLSNTDLNLLRVTDILTTYEERIGPLGREKEKAEKFLVLSAEHKEILISLIMSDLDEMQGDEARLAGEADTAEKRFNEALREKDETAGRKAALEAEMERKAEIQSALKEEFFMKRGQAESVEKDRQMSEAAKSDKEKLRDRSESLKKASGERCETEKIALADLKADLESGSGERETVGRMLAEKRSALAQIEEYLKSTEEEQKGLKDEDEDSDVRLNSLRKEEMRLHGEIAGITGRIEDGKSTLAGYRASTEMNISAKAAVEEEIASLEAEKSAKEAELSLLRKESEEGRKELEEGDSRVRSLSEEIRASESQIRLLRNLEEHFEGYSRSVKLLMEHLKSGSSRRLGRIRLVGDAIRPLKGFESALETALGAAVSNIITDDENIAKELIGVLREKNFGRATFLPRNVMKGTRVKQPQLKKGSILGNILDFLEVEEGYSNIAENLLGRVFVSENIDHATAAAKEMGYQYRIVTLTGDVVNAGGSMTGGSTAGKNSGLFSRKTQLTEITEGLTVLRNNREEASAARQEKAKALEERGKAERELSYAVSLLDIEIAKKRERSEVFGADVRRLHSVLAETEMSVRSRQDELASLNELLSEIDVRISSFQEERGRNRQQQRELKEMRTEAFRSYDAMKEEITGILVTEGRLLEVWNAKEEDVRRREELIRALLDEEKMHGIEAEEAERAIAELEEKLLRLKEEKQGLDSFLAGRESELDRISMDEVRDKASLREISGALATIEEEYHVLDKDLMRKKDALEKLKGERISLVNRINDELDMTLAQARDEIIELPDKDAARKRLNQLRKEISGLGSVNTAAIEEFREVSIHRDFLTAQRKDLEDAKSELKELITDMTLRMRIMFQENFKVMSENFEDTFRRLFSGGHARLILGEGDVLEAPIEISVQPPGKKLQNITLMSGGEKVLSAIALTFAILRMKPTPFCILDEIEAALDEANVARFSAFLREFAQETQFILITHRKGTMEASDVLYGVTMEEKGVSKIVSLDLSAERRKREIG